MPLPLLLNLKKISESVLLLPPIPITVPLPKLEGIPLYVLGQLTESDVELAEVTLVDS